MARMVDARTRKAGMWAGAGRGTIVVPRGWTVSRRSLVEQAGQLGGPMNR